MKIILTWVIGLALCFFIWGYVVTLAVDAIPVTKHHAVAAGQWQHQPGYGDYAKFEKQNP